MLHDSIRSIALTFSSKSLRLSSPGSFFCSGSLYYSTQTRLITQPNDGLLIDQFDYLLRRFGSVRCHKQTHAQIIITGSFRSGFLAARLISNYSNCGLVLEARNVFETTVSHGGLNVILWNSVLRANVSHRNYKDAVALYRRMRNNGVEPDGYTYPLVLKALAAMGNYNLCRTIHNHVLQLGLDNNLHVGNELLELYAKLGCMNAARKVFDRMPVRNTISWNMLVSGFSFNHDSLGAIQMFERMEIEGFEPNIVTWTALLSSHSRCQLHGKTLKLFGMMRQSSLGASAESLSVVLSACANVADSFRDGWAIHGYIIKGGFDNYMIVKNSLIYAYGKHAYPEKARILFLEMKMKNIVSWNSLITALVESGFCDQAMEIFSELEMSDQDTEIRPNVVSWSAIIGGFASQGKGGVALDLFRRMQFANRRANQVTLSSVLPVCADLGALPLGKEIHAHAVKSMINSHILVSNGLINMYAKCGSFREANLIFKSMDVSDIISWNTMIAGYGMHGYGSQALETFNQMLEENFQPDGVSFVALLSACGHAGLVSDGRDLFNRMSREFGIEPQMEHYACMVDLLGRAGLVKEAIEIVRNMPMEPNAYVWGSLLNSSRVHKNPDLAKEIADHIFSLSSDTAGSLMLLSNIYAANGRWEDSAEVRLSARMKGLKKVTGQSWIEIKKKVHTFSSGSVGGGTDLEGAYQMVEELSRRMEIELGYVPDKSYVFQNVGEDEKKQMLNGHSEKLAIAVGHAKISAGMVIRVMKNLRVCGDCHTWTKYFSKMTGREVIVRDARRFHHFANGSCSCKDYW